MHALVRTLRQDERGQAMVLGAVSMLVLVLTVLTTLSIGNGVYEKMKLQDAADAQAYSTAVKEARAFNFVAYVNRAMVVHYNAMLTVMGYLSHALYLWNTVGRAASVLKYVPYIGMIFNAVEQVIKTWRNVVDTVAKAVIPILTYLNVGLWVVQETVVASTFLDLLSAAADDPVRKTDRNARLGFASGKVPLGGALGFLYNYENAANFVHPLDDGPSSQQTSNIMTFPWSDPTGLRTRAAQYGRTKLSQPKNAKYRLLMNNIVNGARREWTAIGKGPFLLGRRWSLSLCFVIGKIMISKEAETKIRSFHESWNGNIKDQLYSRDAISIRVRVPCWGWPSKTKTILDYRTDVAADFARGYHRESLSGGFGGASQRDHFWQGITPFIHSDPSFINPKQLHFGYPCNFSVATKDVSSKPPIFNLKTNYLEGKGTRPESGKLDLSINSLSQTDGGAFIQMTGGMLAIAVGRAVYHRPGAWSEEPNFFNPLWTARLAPVRTHFRANYLLSLGLLTTPIVAILSNGTVEPRYFNY